MSQSRLSNSISLPINQEKRKLKNLSIPHIGIPPTMSLQETIQFGLLNTSTKNIKSTILNSSFSNKYKSSKDSRIKIRPKILIASPKTLKFKDYSVNLVKNDGEFFQKLGIEAFLKEKIKNEASLIKKCDIIIAAAEKLSQMNRDFAIFYNILQDFFFQLKEQAIFDTDNRLKCSEIEKENNKLQVAYSQLSDDFIKLNKNNTWLKKELTKLTEKYEKIKTKIKKQPNLLQGSRDKGLLLENKGHNTLALSNKLKHLSKSLELSVKKLMPNKMQSPEVPKLKMVENKNAESYQDEFMSKYNEFSESWRNQIIKDHNL